MGLSFMSFSSSPKVYLQLIGVSDLTPELQKADPYRLRVLLIDADNRLQFFSYKRQKTHGKAKEKQAFVRSAVHYVFDILPRKDGVQDCGDISAFNLEMSTTDKGLEASTSTPTVDQFWDAHRQQILTNIEKTPAFENRVITHFKNATSLEKLSDSGAKLLASLLAGVSSGGAVSDPASLKFNTYQDLIPDADAKLILMELAKSNIFKQRLLVGSNHGDLFYHTQVNHHPMVEAVNEIMQTEGGLQAYFTFSAEGADSETVTGWLKKRMSTYDTLQQLGIVTAKKENSFTWLNIFSSTKAIAEENPCEMQAAILSGLKVSASGLGLIAEESEGNGNDPKCIMQHALHSCVGSSCVAMLNTDGVELKNVCVA